jgi:formylglycine-generating enzyme required for sulfatase activity
MTAVIILAARCATAAENPAEARFKGSGKADPIRIEHWRVTKSPAARQSAIVFDLAWDYSWREAWEVPAQDCALDGADAKRDKAPLKLENWDAAWVFVKFRVPGGVWRHATLSPHAADHGKPAGVALEVGLDDNPGADGKATGHGIGVFVHRDSAGNGPNAWTGLSLRWLHGADEVSDPAAAEIRVIGIKMVHVPRGAFWVGDEVGALRTRDVCAQFQAGNSNAPLRIESEAALTLGGASVVNLGNHDGWGLQFSEDFSSWVTQQLPAKFPKGVAAFYCMRSELTEGQYVEFLNTLTYKQQREHTDIPPEKPAGTKCLCLGAGKRCRNSVAIAVPGGQRVAERVPRSDGVLASVMREKPAEYRTDTPHAACNHLITPDHIAYACWAGLRPMTELEYEKACRGPVRPVPDEYAWGDPNVVNDKDPVAKYEVRNIGQPDECVVCVQGEGVCNAAWWGMLGRPIDKAGRKVATPTNQPAEFLGPLRAEVFAAPNSTRVSAGASYWGILEMSGNLWERTISVGTKAGRRFEGTHGNGTPYSSPGWHLLIGPDPLLVDEAMIPRAIKPRGGSFGYADDKQKQVMRVSDRTDERVRDDGRAGGKIHGLRCVRTAL